MKKVFIAPALIAFLVAGCASTELKKENEELKKQLASSQAHEKQLESGLKAKDDELKKQQENYEKEIADLRVKFADEGKNGDISIKKVKGGLSVSVADRLFFATGSAELTLSGKRVLDKIATVIKKMADRAVRIDGHTDSRPIKKGSNLYQVYPTNWELGAARAVNVVRYLTEKAGVSTEIISATSYSKYHPIESNDTRKGRAKNRRIEIILIDKDLNNSIAPAK